MKRYYGLLLLAEIVVVAVTTLIFINVQERPVAGAIAGTLFVILGTFIFLSGLRNPEKRGATFWAGCLHLFVSSLPLMITRFLNSSVGFEDVLVLGLPGPVFHRVSTTIYTILLIATAYDFLKAVFKTKKRKIPARLRPEDIGEM